jgi:hypothetical protein
MANNIIDGEIRQRQISVEEATTKLTWQRQGFVLYMPKVHKKQLGIDVGKLYISSPSEHLLNHYRVSAQVYCPKCYQFERDWQVEIR